MKTFYVHVGLPKAFSTSIQNYIFNVQNKSKDFLFINDTFVSNEVSKYYKSFKKNIYGYGGVAIYDFKKLSNDEIQNFKEKINKISCNKIIISDESLFGNPYTNYNDRKKIINNIKSICNGEIKILLSLRNQKNWSKSFFNTSIQQGTKNSYKNFINKKGHLSINLKEMNLLNHIEDFRSSFGKDNIVITFCEKNIDEYKKDIDFFFGFKNSNIQFPRRNASFNKYYHTGRLIINKLINQKIVQFFNNYRIIYYISVYLGYIVDLLKIYKEDYSLPKQITNELNEYNNYLFEELDSKILDDYIF
tara:strand:+ start:1891 stop:2802 length:912 start_codon:yes stop_codon:yes gene_type:complete